MAAPLRLGCRALSVARGEAVEALEHLQDQLYTKENIDYDQQKRIDKNREDKNKRLSFAIMGQADFQLVNKMLYETHHPYEVLTRHLGLVSGVGSIPDVDRQLESILLKNLTLVAYDEVGRPVGVVVNNSSVLGELATTMEEALAEVGDPRYRPIRAILHQLRMDNKRVYEEIGTDKMFSIRMFGVSPLAQGQGIATNLVRRSILLAGCLGFRCSLLDIFTIALFQQKPVTLASRAIKSEVTGVFGKKTFEKVGMLPASTIDYSTFEFEGSRPFAGIADRDQGITFWKKKFFQSALKHIL